MIRRTVLKAILSLSTIGYLMINTPSKSYAGSGGPSSGGGSSSNDSGGGSTSGNSSGGSSSDSAAGGGSSSSNRVSSSRDGGSSPDRPSGPDDSLSGSNAGDSTSQDELLKRLNQSLESDGLETVTPDNLQSTLDAFK